MAKNTPRGGKRKATDTTPGWRLLLRDWWRARPSVFRRVAKLVVGVSTILGLLTGGEAVCAWRLSSRPVGLSVTFYDRGPDGLRSLSDYASLTLNLPEVASNDRLLRQPVRLGLRNLEKRSLDVEQVEIAVFEPTELRVATQEVFSKTMRGGRQRVGILPPGDFVQPLPGVDTLLLPVRVETVGWLRIGHGGVPEFRPWLATSNGIAGADTLLFPVEVTVRCKARPPFRVLLVLQLPPLYNLLWTGRRDTVQADHADVEMFRRLERRQGVIVDSWNAVDPGTQSEVAYSQEVLGGRRFLCVRVGRVLRLVYCDQRRDRTIDRELLDTDGDGSADIAIRAAGEPRVMFTWNPAVLSFNDVRRRQVVSLMKEAAIGVGEVNAYSWP